MIRDTQMIVDNTTIGEIITKDKRINYNYEGDCIWIYDDEEKRFFIQLNEIDKVDEDADDLVVYINNIKTCSTKKGLWTWVRDNVFRLDLLALELYAIARDGVEKYTKNEQGIRHPLRFHFNKEVA